MSTEVHEATLDEKVSDNAKAIEEIMAAACTPDKIIIALKLVQLEKRMDEMEAQLVLGANDDG